MLALSLRGLEMSMRVVVYVTVAAIAVLLFYFVVAIPHVDFTRKALNIATDPAGSVLHLPEGNGPGLPFGITGIMLSLPFGVYMFLAVEQLPLIAEEAKNPKCDMPRALILSIVTLIIFALGVLFFSASIPEGAYAMGRSGEPLLDGFRTNFGDGCQTPGLSRCSWSCSKLSYGFFCFRAKHLFTLARWLFADSPFGNWKAYTNAQCRYRFGFDHGFVYAPDYLVSRQ